jgi:ATP-dependent DNA helicase RecG
MNLVTPLEKIKGVGSKTGEQFAAANIYTVGDLVEFLPRAHEDFSEVASIIDIHPGKATIKAHCEKIATRPVRRGLRITTATLADATSKLQAVWFNQPYRETQLRSGEEFFFSGNFEFNYNKYQLTNPSVEKVSDMPVQTDRLLPVYKAVN